jgi:hypothetical protein
MPKTLGARWQFVVGFSLGFAYPKDSGTKYYNKWLLL